MSRCGYDDSCDGWDLIRYRGAVASAIRGKRGQAFLRELLAALDALPEKRLIANELIRSDGECCALGAVGKVRGLTLDEIEPDDRYTVAEVFGIAEAMSSEIMFVNDEMAYSATPGQRYSCVRQWVIEHLNDPA